MQLPSKGVHGFESHLFRQMLTNTCLTGVFYWVTYEHMSANHLMRTLILLETEDKMKHVMNLHEAPFELIKNGNKTIELRLNDEKRSKIKKGDQIEFIVSGHPDRTLLVEVMDLHVFDSFQSLYQALPLEKCGYKNSEIDQATPDDMLGYYPKETQDRYGVLGIEIKRL